MTARIARLRLKVRLVPPRTEHACRDHLGIRMNVLLDLLVPFKTFWLQNGNLKPSVWKANFLNKSTCLSLMSLISL